ncbi:MAG: phage portal protein, partial [Lachnospiraceae bacterium]|nr:phage portal protein [Lachnospiraceae bacterium]
EVPTGDGAKATPYTQEIPHAARMEYLDSIRTGIYEDFGGLDVHQVSANSTNDHLQAAYQPLDENADDFERHCIEFIQQILVVAGFEPDMPIFKRNRISNQREQVDMVIAEADYLDTETILGKLPNITPDEVKEILRRRDQEDIERFRSDNRNRGNNGTSEEEEDSEG